RPKEPAVGRKIGDQPEPSVRVAPRRLTSVRGVGTGPAQHLFRDECEPRLEKDEPDGIPAGDERGGRTQPARQKRAGVDVEKERPEDEGNQREQAAPGPARDETPRPSDRAD